MSKRQGTYIVLEGLDGSGKSTQFSLLLQKLNGAIGVREPGGTPMGEAVRSLILNKDLPRAVRTNLYLFSAARADLIDTTIAPALAQNKTVISDRNWLSTYAYQAGGEAVSIQEILSVSEQATGPYFAPDLVVFIDTPILTCQKRMATSQKHGGKDYFDSRTANFFTKTRQAYLKAITQLPHAEVVDGAGQPDTVHSAILRVVQRHFPRLSSF